MPERTGHSKSYSFRSGIRKDQEDYRNLSKLVEEGYRYFWTRHHRIHLPHNPITGRKKQVYMNEFDGSMG